MDHLMVLLLLLWSSGLKAEGQHSSTEPDDVRLVGGGSRCVGTLELDHEEEWRPVDVGISYWTLKEAAVFCRQLNCGSAISVAWRKKSSRKSVWFIISNCVESRSAQMECVKSWRHHSFLDLTCSDSVRLVNGKGRCSGRLEVRSDQSNQSWSSVCEAAFDQQDAEVVCRELGCGAPSVLQGALFVEAPMWTREFQCGGDESALLDCRSSGSDRNACSPGRAVELTCSEPVRLVGGNSRCSGTLEVKYQRKWRPVEGYGWTLKEAAVVCRDLDCGSAISLSKREESSYRYVWNILPFCVHSVSPLKDCVTSLRSSRSLDLTCSDSVRLVDGTSLCSGRLEVKSDQSRQSWSSVCEAAFDQQDAEVVCRELGCLAPSVLQGAIFGEVEAPMWTKEFQCGGDESALLDCRNSGSDRNTCSHGRAVGLTCSESDGFRLVGGDSHCSGALELKHQGEWRPVTDSVSVWTLKETAIVCRMLDCGSAVSVAQRKESSDRSVWWIRSSCIQSRSALRECVISSHSSSSLDLTCSDILHQPNISASSLDGVSRDQQQGEFQVMKGSNFTISCSIQPQYPGGSFRLSFTSSNSAINYTQPAFNHSADFLFTAAEPAHQGNYSCVHHLHGLSHNFSFESSQLSVSVLDLLLQPSISASSMDGVSRDQQQGEFQVMKGSNFTISCSIQPQYPGGSFQLSFTSSNSAINYTQPAVNHSADFLFTAADPAHQGNYSCVIHISVFSHNFSSKSSQLSVFVLDVSDPTSLIVRVVILPLTFLLLIAVLYFFHKVTRGQKLSRQGNMELDYYNLGVPTAEGGPAEEEAAQGAQEHHSEAQLYSNLRENYQPMSETFSS